MNATQRSDKTLVDPTGLILLLHKRQGMEQWSLAAGMERRAREMGAQEMGAQKSGSQKRGAQEREAQERRAQERRAQEIGAQERGAQWRREGEQTAQEETTAAPPTTPARREKATVIRILTALETFAVAAIIAKAQDLTRLMTAVTKKVPEFCIFQGIDINKLFLSIIFRVSRGRWTIN